jgi:hypothetical protein
VVARRRATSGALAAAALFPALLWLWPAFLQRQAPSFRDQGDFFYPLKLYTADRIAAGEIPLWNPLSGLGEPWLANGQSGVFYPPTWLFLIPRPGLAAGLFLLLHFGIAAWGTWLFLKQEAVSDAGALAGAVAFAGGGFAASLSAYWNHFGAFAYMPAIAALARSGLSRRSSRAGLSVLVGLQVMAGSPEITAATLVLAALFAWEARREETGWLEASRGRRFLRLAVAAALGLALGGWTLLPLAELLPQSERRSALPAVEREAGAVGFPALSSAVGLSTEWSGSFYLLSFYLGPVLLLAVCAAISESERRRLVLLLLGIAAAGILLCMAGPPGTWLRALPGPDRLRYPAKSLALTAFAFAVLAGMGADRLRFLPSKKLALLLAGLAAAVLLALSRQPPVARAAEAVGLSLLLLLALGAGTGRTAGARGAILEAGAALAVTISLALSGRGVFHFAPESEIRRVPESVASLRRLPGRVLTPPVEEQARWIFRDSRFDAATLRRQREALVGYTNLLAGVSTVRTAAPLATAASKRIADAIDEGKDVAVTAGPASARVLWVPYQPVAMGSRKTGDFFLTPLNPYRPRLSFVSSYRVEANPQKAWREVASGGIDWSREVLLDREPAPRPDAGGKRPFLIARIAEDLPERVAADVTCGAAGILVLTDLWYPGWSAELDGHPVEILRADGCVRALAVPAGEHHVVFRYRPRSFLAGAAVSVLSLAAILFSLWKGPA